jgi:acetylornithine deacetylase/succinyl-diaminopimelate desuccinylase-like protein
MTTLERGAVANGAQAWLELLSGWVAIPSVSADPGHRADVAASAQYLAAAFTDAGFPTVRVLDGPYQPAVFAHWPSGEADAVRVVVYGHHDVQPAAFADGWTFQPFEPHIVDGVLHGRGASDDKGNIALHLLGLGAHLAATGRSAPAVDLTFIVEGEEESGSPHISALLADLKGELDADVIVVSDAGIFDADTPSLVTGMRGLVGGEIHVHGPGIDLHSGSFGGAVANPITELARILAALHDDDRHIAIPGFYTGVDEPSELDRSLVAALPFDEAAWIAGPARSTAAVGEAGFSTLERIGMRPTAEINGIWGGYTGPGGKTIVPTDAYAKVSFRLVGRQDPAAIRRAVEAFIATQTRPGVTATITWEGAGVRPLVLAADHPAMLAARAAFAAAFDTDTVLVTREGGSGPEAELAESIGAPMIFVGVMTDDDQIHAPDERAPVSLLLKGAEAVAHLWRELAAAGRAAMA